MRLYEAPSDFNPFTLPLRGKPWGLSTGTGGRTMKGGTRVAAGVAAGYLMGRTKKMKLALMVTAAGVTGGLAKSPGGLARRAVGGLGASGPVESLMGTVRGELKSAATAAATRRIDALTERLSGSSGAGEDDAEQEQPEEEKPEEGEPKQGRGRGRKQQAAESRGRRRDRDDDSEQDSEPEQESEQDSEPEPYRPVKRRRAEPAQRRTTAAEPRGEASRTARRPSRAASGTSGTTERRTRR